MKFIDFENIYLFFICNFCVLCGEIFAFAEPLQVRAQVEPGPFFVGQGINVRVVVIAAEERPEVIPPDVRDAELTLIGTDLEPILSEGIGSVVNETNAYFFHYRLVPRKAGLLILPAFRASLGDRSGASGPLRIEVRSPMRVGRPLEFLGGVGPLEVAASARPDVVRIGQELVYELLLSGPGAFGSTRRPELRDLDRLPIELEVTPLPVEVVDHPPSRTFRYRLRPLSPGVVTLPPFSISTFDPGTGRYFTSWTSGVPVRVVDVPRFEHDALSYAPPPLMTADQTSRRVFLEIGLGMLLLALMVATRYWVAHDWRDPRRFAGRVARRLANKVQGKAIDPREAQRIADDLARYLRRANGRPEGALTPIEARRGIEQVTADLDLAERAGRLLAHCDRIRYADRDNWQADLDVAGEAIAVFRDLGGLRVRAARVGVAFKTGGGTSDR
ncbi:hypothetical protein BH23PLA1_BH23PLA1_33010 [soil metagenome]